MIHAMSDLETDTATQEINAAKASPWPPDMRDQIWSDRLLLRFKMKKEMKAYRSFLEEVVIKNHNGSDEQRANENNNDCDEKIIDINNAIPILQQFCTDTLSIKQLRSIFQLPRSELTEVLKAKYKICSAYAILFCGVVEQVANFGRTGYGVDARCNNGDDTTEEIFEDELKFEKVGPGFCLKLATKTNNCNGGGGGGDDDGWEVNEDVLHKFLQRMISLAGPILLARAAKVSHDNSNESDDDDDGEADGDNISGSEIQPGTNVPSFRSDRRVARLMIARYWADRLMEKYNEVQKKKKEDEVEEEVEGQQ